MNKMDKFAAVVVDFDDGSTHRGTGYALTAERIITARHLIVPDSGENPVKIRVYWEAIAAMVEATVVETLTQTLDPDYDVLLLACTVPPEVQHAGYLLREHPDRSVKWQSRGYARVGEERCVAVGGQTVKLRESTLMQGASFEGGHQDNILVLAAVGKVDVPEHWCGVSGAPVFLDGTDSIMGVLVASPQGFAAGRLCATPMWSLMAEQAFTTALGFDQHYDALAELKDEVAWLLSEHADVCDLLRRQLCPQAVQAEDVADTLTQQVKLESLIKACSSLANKSIKRNHQPQADVLLKLLNHLLPLCFDPAVVHRVSHATSAVCSVDIANNTAAAVVMAAMGKRAVQFRQHVGDREPTGICYLENPALDAVLGIEERVTIFSTELTHRFSGIDQLHPNQAKELKDLISYAVTFLECEAEEGRIYYFLYVLEKSPSEQHEQIMIFERVKALFPPIVFLGISSAPESINRDRKLFYHLNKLYAPHLSGTVDATGMRIGIVVSRFNSDITEALLDGARSALLEHGSIEDLMTVVHVPGAFEIGTIAAAMANSGRFDAIVCLGCVIRGDTAHFDYVCQGAMDAIGSIAQRGDIAIANGVLTLDTLAQAEARIGGAHGHKGEEAALTAVVVATALRALKESGHE